MITTKKKLTHIKKHLKGWSVSSSAQTLKKGRSQAGSLFYHALLKRIRTLGKEEDIITLLHL